MDDLRRQSPAEPNIDRAMPSNDHALCPFKTRQRIEAAGLTAKLGPRLASPPLRKTLSKYDTMASFRTVSSPFELPFWPYSVFQNVM